MQSDAIPISGITRWPQKKGSVKSVRAIQSERENQYSVWTLQRRVWRPPPIIKCRPKVLG